MEFKGLAFLKEKGYSFWVLVFIIFVYFGADMLHHQWMRDEGYKRGVIKNDVIGYYGYLPAVFIYGDYKLDFIHSPDFKNDDKYWVIRLDNGNKIIQYTSGLALCYSPFFLMAHALAPAFGQERDGFNWVYQFFLVMSALFYVVLALIVLRKFLLEYFSDTKVAAVLLLLCFGTNLFYYSVYEATVSHSYSFAFIVFFIYMVKRWYEKTSILNTVLLGFFYGVTVLIRPTNILVLILLLLWGVKSKEDIFARIRFLLSRTPQILLMILVFLIPWIPQLLYWKAITGHFFYNNYEEVGSAFYFLAPQTHDMLFSFRKGWFLYTPIMLIAFGGFYLMYKQRQEFFWSMFPYLLIMIYVMSAWWSWWFGGSFGCRAMVDTYGIMVFPLAIVMDNVFRQRNTLFKYSLFAVLCLLISLQLLQNRQYTHGKIHYVAMTKEAYFKKFFKVKGRNIWPHLSDPDYDLARMGIYYFYDWDFDYDAFRGKEEHIAKQEIYSGITSEKKIMRAIKRHAKRNDMQMEEALEMVVETIYLNKSGRKNLQ
jgi:hypothetical protein